MYYVYNVEMDETQLVCIGCHTKREDLDLVMVFDFARIPKICVRDEKKPIRSLKISSRYTEVAVLDSFIQNQVESSNLRNVPFPLCIERGNVASSFNRYYFSNYFLKWSFAISMYAIIFFVVKSVKNQNK